MTMTADEFTAKILQSLRKKTTKYIFFWTLLSHSGLIYNWSLLTAGTYVSDSLFPVVFQFLFLFYVSERND